MMTGQTNVLEQTRFTTQNDTENRKIQDSLEQARFEFWMFLRLCFPLNFNGAGLAHLWAPQHMQEQDHLV